MPFDMFYVYLQYRITALNGLTYGGNISAKNKINQQQLQCILYSYSVYMI